MTLFQINGAELIYDYIDLDGHSDNHVCIRFKSDNNIIVRDEDAQLTKLVLIDLLKEEQDRFSGKKNTTFGYFITNEPKTYQECSNELAGIVLGMPQAEWYHHYSDLTGYLFTSTKLDAYDSMGHRHDLLREFITAIESATGPIYISLEIRSH